MEATTHGEGHESSEEKKAKKVEVLVENEDDGDSYHLQGKLTEPLSEVIDKLYEKKLKRARRAGDRLRCESGGEDVFPLEALSFEAYLAQGHCPKLEWLFSGKAGGA
jgi:hypothetical protein